MLFIFNYFTHSLGPAAVAAVVMLFLGFVFAAVSGYLVGIIGVSNQPDERAHGIGADRRGASHGGAGNERGAAIAAVLGVAAFTCTSVSVAGEMMQDLKAGHILAARRGGCRLGISSA